MSEWIECGVEAPLFVLKDHRGHEIELKALRGKPVVLYFYPKDDTPGCTKQACAFRDGKSELEALDAVVLGVSPDGPESHRSFREKFELNFPLLCDETHAVGESYGAWRQRNLYGKKFMGIQRSTFLIDKDGVVRKIWKRVKVDGHEQAVLEALRAL